MVCVCVHVCVSVISEVLQLVFALLSLHLSGVELRQQVLMLPLFKVSFTPFKK